jgi:hypothetical protein
VALFALGTGLLVALTGCESTVDAAHKIAVQGSRAFHVRGLSVSHVDRRIHVVSTTVIHDANGTAAVVELRNTTARSMVDAPIAINVDDSTGKSVFRNNAPGLENSLSHVPLLPPGTAVAWVNDQVLPAGAPRRVVARVGAGRSLHSTLPKIEISSVGLTFDSVSGWAASGTVRNVSHVDQLRLVLFATARRGRQVVAAGRAIVQRLLAGKGARFHAYFIGNPRGAQISISAPPSNLA